MPHVAGDGVITCSTFICVSTHRELAKHVPAGIHGAVFKGVHKPFEIDDLNALVPSL
jgi:hypothetical protein